MSSWVGADQFQSNASAAASDTSKTRGAQRHHRRQKWGLDGDEILVTLLKEEYATTRGQASSFKCEVWSRIATAFSEKAKESVTGASSATGRFAVGSTEERTIVDVEGSGSSASIPVEQDFDGNGDVHMGGRDESDVYRTGTKRNKSASDNPRAGKKSGDATAAALEKLVELSAGRSKIVEQYDSDENYSYKLCMNKLTAMPSITAEEIFVGGQAFKQRDERVSEFRHARQQRQQVRWLPLLVQ
ncbi:hypothetical protein J5N97_016990 [Dioscorea zingiberensis]|uniref:Myb/SANT-like domain-containing protein n=1 Tax=Dioscorea zingiberensis TaxID=325984 RepID=A0A9D5CN06_9LILI|nr:hypothetical protein J5N97_016990 [Dioscorea zingiberensis]